MVLGTPSSCAKADHLARLARIEWQVRSMAYTVEDDRYCIRLLTHISAITWAPQEVALGLLDNHLRHRMLAAARSDPAEADGKPRELATIGPTLAPATVSVLDTRMS